MGRAKWRPGKCLCLRGKGHKGPEEETGTVFSKFSKVTVFYFNSEEEMFYFPLKSVEEEG